VIHDSIRSLDLQHRLQLVERLDARIARARRAEREALARGTLIGISLFFLLDTLGGGLPVLVRAAFAVILCGSEFLVRRLVRGKMEGDLEALLERSTEEGR
jgi:hypothetical protein